jgi:hypothetical protein
VIENKTSTSIVGTMARVGPNNSFAVFRVLYAALRDRIGVPVQVMR